MTPAAHALLDGLFDYAGLFPPSALDLDAATAHFADYRQDGDAWMLGRFIVPAAVLADGDAVGDVSRRFADNARPWRFSVLGLPVADGESWADAARRTLAAAREFDGMQDGRTTCDRFELRLPSALAMDPDRLTESLLALDQEYRAGSGTGPRAALEVPFREHPDTTEPAAHAIARANAEIGRPAFAVKLRCGGVTPDLVPGVEPLARALTAVVRSGAPFKATAGLHHPFPNWDDAVSARMHGFLGVFGGAILARLHGLDSDALAEIIDSDAVGDWSVGDELRWTSLAASAAEVADGRNQLALSFGTCSFDEPRDDLRKLGWL